MTDLSTKYMGLKLQNPLIVGSSGLTKDIKGIHHLAENGAGALVLKSLFEEQIQKEMVEDIEQHMVPSWHYEARDYITKMGMELGPRDYLKLIENAKKSVSLPIIASLNCVSSSWWIDYAKQIENSGADGLELNIAYLASDMKNESSKIEHIYYRVLEKVKSNVEMPVAVKLGPYFTSFAQVANEICRRGASALVLFNRFYNIDIDTKRLKIIGGSHLSTADEMYLPLRWISLLFGRINCDLVATTGIHNGDCVIKQILAGAQAVQVCSVIYKNGAEYLKTMLNDINSWMEKNGYKSLDEIRGKLSQKESDNPELYERLQYIKALVGVE